MTNPYSFQYIVNATDIDIIGYVIDFRLERELEKMLDKLTFKVSRSIDSFSGFIGFNPNCEILLSYSGTGIFRGRVKTADKKEYYTIEAYSCGEILNRIIAQKVYQQTTPEDIFSDLITTYTDLIPNTVPSGVTIQYLVVDDYISAILKKLNDVLGWFLYTNSNKNIYFKPRGKIENPLIIRRQTSSSNAIFGEWKKDHNEMCNDIKITGCNINYTTSQSFTGDGITKEFYLNELIVNVKVSIDDVEQDKNTYIVYPQLKKIIFDTEPTNGASIVINYTYVYPLYAARSDNTSINTYGKFSKILFCNWLTTRSDIITYCNNYINIYKNPLLSNNIIMNASYITSFVPGEKVQIIDDFDGYNDYYIINKIKLSYLKGTVELNIGSYIPIFISLQSSILDRIKDLEKTTTGYLAFSQSLGIDTNISLIMTLKGVNGFDCITDIVYTLENTSQTPGTFLVGTARVGFADAG